jgi:hypothetical protein
MVNIGVQYLIKNKSGEYKDKISNIVLNDDDYVFVYNENVNNLFEISSKEELENDEEGLSEVLEWVN